MGNPSSTITIKRKVKTGCVTCRIRRIKCDEAKPNCLRCTSTGRACDGYLASSVSRREICHVLHRDTNLNALFTNTHIFENSHERRSFDYFRAVAMPRSAKFFGGEFWGKRVLQISHCEPAIKHAVLALSTLHQHVEMGGSRVGGENLDSARWSYNKALASTSKMLLKEGRESFEKGLIACALFTFYENILGNYASAKMHLQNGLRIISESRAKGAKDGRKLNHAVPNDILQVFSRLDLQAMTFSDSRSPYPFTKSTHTVFDPEPIPSSFSSISEAQNHLLEHMKWVFAISELYAATTDPSDGESAASFMATKSKHNKNIAKWDAVFGTFVDQLEQKGDLSKEVLYGSVILHVYRTVTSFIGDASPFGSELCYDDKYDLFERILTLIECLPEVGKVPAGDYDSNAQKSLSLELGIVMPLFLTASKCRHPSLRRRAIAHLNALNHREGTWDSFGAAKVAEKLMSVEEEGLQSVQSADDVLEEKRIIETHVVVFTGQGKIDLTLLFRPDPTGPVVTREETVTF